MKQTILISALAAFSLAASPVAAAVPHGSADTVFATQSASYDRGHNHRGSRYDRDRHYSGSRHGDHRYDRRHYNDRNYRHCYRKDGTAGMLIGGAAGAAVGNEVAGDGDKTTGILLGAAGGALIGKSLDDGVKCR